MKSIEEWRQLIDHPTLDFGVIGEQLLREAVNHIETLTRQPVACWFVERGTGQWWTGTDWTRDPNKAIRFCRRKDADAVIMARDLRASMWIDCNPFASEHVFFYSPGFEPSDILDPKDR